MKMKKSIFFLLAIIFAIEFAKAQPVSDNAVIPMSVTLNSILRLNVSSGGNIEFVVNTIDQYTTGIPNGARYTTKFSVASSIDFIVDLYAEDATFMNADGAGTMPLDNVGYYVVIDGGGHDGTNWNIPYDQGGSPAVLGLLTNTADPIITSIDNNGAGNTTQNAWEIQWQLATNAVTAVNATGLSLLAQSLKDGRYTTNVFLVLKPLH